MVPGQVRHPLEAAPPPPRSAWADWIFRHADIAAMLVLVIGTVAAMAVYGRHLRALLPEEPAPVMVMVHEPVAAPPGLSVQDRNTSSRADSAGVLPLTPPVTPSVTNTALTARMRDLGLGPWMHNPVYGQRVVASLTETAAATDAELEAALARLEAMILTGNFARGRFPIPMTISRPLMALLTPEVMDVVRGDLYRALNVEVGTQVTQLSDLTITTRARPRRSGKSCARYSIAFAQGWFGDRVSGWACFRSDRGEWITKNKPDGDNR